MLALGKRLETVASKTDAIAMLEHEVMLYTKTIQKLSRATDPDEQKYLVWQEENGRKNVSADVSEVDRTCR